MQATKALALSLIKILIYMNIKSHVLVQYANITYAEEISYIVNFYMSHSNNN